MISTTTQLPTVTVLPPKGYWTLVSTWTVLKAETVQTRLGDINSVTSSGVNVSGEAVFQAIDGATASDIHANALEQCVQEQLPQQFV